VYGVNSDGTSNIEEYNYAGQGEYHTRTHVAPDAYLYIGV
jgi:surface antigen